MGHGATARSEPAPRLLERLTLTDLIELWAEHEIERRLREVEFFHEEITTGARDLDHLQIMPMRGGFCEGPRTIEVLVEVRDQLQRTSRIGAWTEAKTGSRDDALRVAYDKATAHAIIQLLPANVWREWIGADQYLPVR